MARRAAWLGAARVRGGCQRGRHVAIARGPAWRAARERGPDGHARRMRGDPVRCAARRTGGAVHCARVSRWRAAWAPRLRSTTRPATHFAPRPTPTTRPPPRPQTGAWKHTAGDYPGKGFEDDKGIKTGEDARFYSLTAPLSSEFNNKGKDLIISYTVKHEQNIDCGGAYLKVRWRAGG